jgi:iron complex outermembrane receptor protein
MIFRPVVVGSMAMTTDPGATAAGRRYLAPALLVIMVALGSPDVLSQNAQSADQAPASNSETLTEVVVTAERKAERLQDVPAAVTAISGDDLASRAVLSIPDALVSVPNLQIAYPYGEGGAVNIVIRGISSTDAALNSSKPVALYFDEGVRGMAVFENMPMFDIDRIEVLRGPQGTLYGHNATAGAVNIISRTPGFQTEGYLTAGYGNFRQTDVQGAFQAPIINDVLSARVAFTYSWNEGVFKQLTPGLRNPDQTDVLAVRGSLFFKPSDNFDATLRLTHMTSGGRGEAPIPGPVGPYFNWDAYPGIQAVPGALRQGAGYFDSATDITPSRSIGVDGVNLLAHWRINDSYTLTSVTTFDAGHWTDAEDGDGLPISWQVFQTSAYRNSQLVQDVRITSKLDGPFDWQGGVVHTQDVAHPYSNFLYAGAPQCGSACDFGFGDGSGGFRTVNSFTQRRSGDALYARAEYKVLPSVKVRAGLRESFDHISVSNYSAWVGDTAAPLAVTDFLDQSASATYRQLSKEVGVDWTINPDILAYVSYKEGFRTGAVNSLAALSTAEITIAPPELVKSEELGLKTTLWDRRATANIAMFNSDYRNQQIVEGTVQGGAVIFPLLSLSHARSRGIEVETTVLPIPQLKLSANFSLLDPKYTDAAYSGTSINGNQMVQAAKRSGSLSADATLFSRGENRLALNINATYTSKVFYDVLNTDAIAQPGYTVWNSRLDFTHGNTSVDVYVKNLGNKQYFTQGYNEPPILYLLRGYPRQYGLHVTQRF